MKRACYHRRIGAISLFGRCPADGQTLRLLLGLGESGLFPSRASSAVSNSIAAFDSVSHIELHAILDIAFQMSTKAAFGAFDQGQVPTVACFNQATTNLQVDLDDLIAAMQQYVDQHVAPVWGTPAKLMKSQDFVSGAWAMVFLDYADAPRALAYHDLTPEGLPQAKVFVKTTLDNGDKVSVSASHELVEMLVDPAINMMTTGPDRTLVYAYESADPVEHSASM